MLSETCWALCFCHVLALGESITVKTYIKLNACQVICQWLYFISPLFFFIGQMVGGGDRLVDLMQ